MFNWLFGWTPPPIELPQPMLWSYSMIECAHPKKKKKPAKKEKSTTPRKEKKKKKKGK